MRVASAYWTTVTTVERHFIVPNGSVVAEIGLAITWAKRYADDVAGCDTSCDDWARIETDDEGLHIVVTSATEAASDD